jgi:tRNA threonylcarbamoyl adenosine modification protein YeaZ
VLIVVMDTATPAITAAIAAVDETGTGIVAERVTVDARAHGELLAPEIDAVLAHAGAKPRDLGAVVAGLGPGPFTGLRVGLVTAAAMSDALGVPAYGVCSLDALGAQAGAGRVLVATDARRKEVYWAGYADGVRTEGPHVDRPATAPYDGPTYGQGGLLYPDAFPDHREPLLPSAADLARHVAAGLPVLEPVPLYLRRPDAVEPTARKRVLG